MRILVTGSEGNVGSRLCPYLREQGHRVQRLDHQQRYGEDYKLCDITRPGEMWKMSQWFMPQVVVHLAAMVSRVTCEKSPESCIDANLTGLNNVIEVCRNTGARLVFFGTSEVYGDIGGTLSEDRADLRPNNLYGVSKLLGEGLLRYHMDRGGIDAVIVRPFMLYDEEESFGDNRSAMIRFAEGLLTGEIITVHRNTLRSWLHMSDAVAIVERICVAPKHDLPSIINIGHPDLRPTAHIAELMCELANRDEETAIHVQDMPGGMTHDKRPELGRQHELMGGWPQVGIEEGVRRVMARTMDRLIAEGRL